MYSVYFMTLTLRVLLIFTRPSANNRNDPRSWFVLDIGSLRRTSSSQTYFNVIRTLLLLHSLVTPGRMVTELSAGVWGPFDMGKGRVYGKGGDRRTEPTWTSTHPPPLRTPLRRTRGRDGRQNLKLPSIFLPTSSTPVTRIKSGGCSSVLSHQPWTRPLRRGVGSDLQSRQEPLK